MTGTTAARKARHVRRRWIAAAIAVLSFGLFTIFAFSKSNPFSNPFEISAEFSTSTQLNPGSAVRIAGIDVGKVAEIGPGRDGTTRVTMEITDESFPVFRDARFDVEPRLVLEGNFYIRVEPGSPGSGELEDGELVPVSQTTAPVQLDQALNTFDTSTRADLGSSLHALARGLGPAGGKGSGGTAMRAAAAAFDRSLLSVERVSGAAQGSGDGDLEDALESSGETAAQLARSPEALASLVGNYARVSAALADNSSQLSEVMSGLDQTFAVVPETLPPIDAALPELTTFAQDLRPALQQAPAALRPTARLLSQIDIATRPTQLPALLSHLRPVTAELPELLRRVRHLSGPIDDFSDCLDSQIIPALYQEVPDEHLSTGDPVWVEFLHAGASIAGTSPNFDGNGTQIRLGVTEGDQSVAGNLPTFGNVRGVVPSFGGMNPVWLGYGVEPAASPGSDCSEQPLPDLGARKSDGPADWLTPLQDPNAGAGDTEEGG